MVLFLGKTCVYNNPLMKFGHGWIEFLSHKINFVTLCFRHFSQKKIIFLETKKFYIFYAFWTQAIILRKVVRRLADKTLTWKISISNNF